MTKRTTNRRDAEWNRIRKRINRRKHKKPHRKPQKRQKQQQQKKPPQQNLLNSRETAAAEAESTTEEDQHMKKKELKAALEKAEAALADHKDQHLRLMAEYQNYRNRTTEEKKKIYGDAKADCIKSLLTVVDTFERAMDAACSDETYKKGIEMTFSQLQKALEQMGVKEIAEVGVEFDPNLHNAIKQMDDTDFEENKVCQIYQKGYLLGDRLIRPAMVAVSV